MIRGHTFRKNTTVSKKGKGFTVEVTDNEEKKLVFGHYQDRIKASVAATLVREMKEKGCQKVSQGYTRSPAFSEPH